MAQTKTMSAIETTTNMASGMGIAWALTYYFLPELGCQLTAGVSLFAACVYSVASWVRGFFWRRFFTWLDVWMGGRSITQITGPYFMRDGRWYWQKGDETDG